MLAVALYPLVVFGAVFIVILYESTVAAAFATNHQGIPALPRTTFSRSSTCFLKAKPISEDPHVETILFVECGFGADSHGQNATKAAVRACRNAIEFNQIPSIGDLVPGRKRENMKLDVLLAVPGAYQDGLDVDAIKTTFPYGQIRVQIQDGGMIANSGKVIAELGDTNTDMVVVCVAVTVGY